LYKNVWYIKQLNTGTALSDDVYLWWREHTLVYTGTDRQIYFRTLRTILRASEESLPSWTCRVLLVRKNLIMIL